VGVKVRVGVRVTDIKVATAKISHGISRVKVRVRVRVRISYTPFHHAKELSASSQGSQP
jgi:hypothetical protein